MSARLLLRPGAVSSRLSSLPRLPPSRASSFASFKVPRVDNEPNVSKHTIDQVRYPAGVRMLIRRHSLSMLQARPTARALKPLSQRHSKRLR